MDKIHISEYRNITESEIWAKGDGYVEVTFEDEVIVLNHKCMVYNWYLFKLYNEYPQLPLNYKYFYVMDEYFNSDVTPKVLGKYVFDLLDVGAIPNVSVLGKLIFEINDDMINGYNDNGLEYLTSPDIFDLLDVYHNPELIAAKELRIPDHTKVEKTYNTLEGIVDNPTTLKGNAITHLIRAKLLSWGQVLQVTCHRGNVSDVNNSIFPKVIMSCFTDGIQDLDESMIESRSATVALNNNAKSISGTEYFGREMQLVSSIVTDLHDGDCGSTRYLELRVTANIFKSLPGANMLDPESGKLLTISSKDTHLIGKVINIRNVNYCDHPHTQGVCATCYGTLEKSIPRNVVLGAISTVILNRWITQSVLATKHLNSNSKVDPFIINEHETMYIKVKDIVRTTGTVNLAIEQIILAPELTNIETKIIIDRDIGMRLIAIKANQLELIDLSTIGSLKGIRLELVNPKTKFTEVVDINTSEGKREAFFTMDVIKLIVAGKWSVDKDDSYVIDLSGWDNKVPILELPMMNSDMYQFMRNVRSLIYKGSPIRPLRKGQSTEGRFNQLKNAKREYITQLIELVSSKTGVNIVHTSIMALTLSTKDKDNGDWNISKADDAIISKYALLMANRSMGTLMAHEKQKGAFININIIDPSKVPNSPYDNIIHPR